MVQKVNQICLTGKLYSSKLSNIIHAVNIKSGQMTTTPNKYLKVFDNILSPEECEKLIEHFDSESKSSDIKYIDRGIANYFRLEENNNTLSETLWNKIKDYIPRHYAGGELVRLNKHFRFSKYEPGMRFDMHRDGTNQDSYGNRSVLTLNIFLNNAFSGGETDFFNEDKSLYYSTKPKQGRAALFDGSWLHCGNEVSEGCKYLLRTDVMLKTL